MKISSPLSVRLRRSKVWVWTSDDFDFHRIECLVEHLPFLRHLEINDKKNVHVVSQVVLTLLEKCPSLEKLIITFNQYYYRFFDFLSILIFLPVSLTAHSFETFKYRWNREIWRSNHRNDYEKSSHLAKKTPLLGRLRSKSKFVKRQFLGFG